MTDRVAGGESANAAHAGQRAREVSGRVPAQGLLVERLGGWHGRVEAATAQADPQAVPRPPPASRRARPGRRPFAVPLAIHVLQRRRLRRSSVAGRRAAAVRNRSKVWLT